MNVARAVGTLLIVALLNTFKNACPSGVPLYPATICHGLSRHSSEAAGTPILLKSGFTEAGTSECQCENATKIKWWLGMLLKQFTNI